MQIYKGKEVLQSIKRNAQTLCVIPEITESQIEHFNFLNKYLYNLLNHSEKSDLFSVLIQSLTAKEKDTLYRTLWFAYVKEDVMALAEEESIKLSSNEVKEITKNFVCGQYDCNLSYWENLYNLVQKKRLER